PSLTSRIVFFFFNAPPPSEFYTLSLHDALPISCVCRDAPRRLRRRRGPAQSLRSRDCRHGVPAVVGRLVRGRTPDNGRNAVAAVDRKSTRLNSSHVSISYAVFCLKKKK